MTKFKINQDLLSSYYEGHFQKDLKGCRFPDSYLGYFDLPQPAPAAFFATHPDSSPQTYYRRMSNEEKILFIAMVAYILAAEKSLLRHLNKTDEAELRSLIDALGLRWIPVFGNNLSFITGWELANYALNESTIRTMDEADALSEAMYLVEPFMNNRLISFAREWKNGEFYERNPSIDFIGAYIGGVLSEALIVIHRRFYTYRGLLGLNVCRPTIRTYYKERFLEDFKNYFSCATMEQDYLKTLEIDYLPCKRWEDGKVGNNPSENLMFSSMLLYIYIAQQSIMKNAGHNAQTAFHECSGWPMIHTGPGGGNYLHPLMMIEYAGLMPLKVESRIYFDTIKSVFPFLREELNSILNGHNPKMRNSSSADTFLNEIRKGRIKQNIIKYLNSEEKQIQDLILKWGDSSKKNCCFFLKENGIPTMIPFD